jgi:hypothetical protein
MDRGIGRRSLELFSPEKGQGLFQGFPGGNFPLSDGASLRVQGVGLDAKMDHRFVLLITARKPGIQFYRPAR